jgi:hypothetical protein
MMIVSWRADDEEPKAKADEARTLCKPFADDPELTAWTEKLLEGLKAWQSRRRANPL